METTSSRNTVELTSDAEKDLKKFRSHQAQIARALIRLETDTHAGHPLAGSLSGARSLEFTVKGSGAFRAVYVVLDDAPVVCLVVMVGPHENIYARAERRVAALKRSGRLARA